MAQVRQVPRAAPRRVGTTSAALEFGIPLGRHVADPKGSRSLPPGRKSTSARLFCTATRDHRAGLSMHRGREVPVRHCAWAAFYVLPGHRKSIRASAPEARFAGRGRVWKRPTASAASLAQPVNGDRWCGRREGNVDDRPIRPAPSATVHACTASHRSRRARSPSTSSSLGMPTGPAAAAARARHRAHQNASTPWRANPASWTRKVSSCVARSSPRLYGSLDEAHPGAFTERSAQSNNGANRDLSGDSRPAPPDRYRAACAGAQRRPRRQGAAAFGRGRRPDHR